MAFVKIKWADVYNMSRTGEDEVSGYLPLFLFYLCFVACAFVAGEGLFSIKIVTKSPLSLPTTKTLLDRHDSRVTWQKWIPSLLALTLPFIETNQLHVYWLRFRAVLSTNHMWSLSTSNTARPNWNVLCISVRYTPVRLWRRSWTENCKIAHLTIFITWFGNILNILD